MLIIGSPGDNDQISGREGNDLLDGRAGNDSRDGGSGHGAVILHVRSGIEALA